MKVFAVPPQHRGSERQETKEMPRQDLKVAADGGGAFRTAPMHSWSGRMLSFYADRMAEN